MQGDTYSVTRLDIYRGGVRIIQLCVGMGSTKKERLRRISAEHLDTVAVHFSSVHSRST